MAVQVVRLAFDDADGDIGAVVGDALEVGQQVVQDKAQLDGALPGLQPADMAHPDLLDQLVNGLLQRLHLFRSHGVIGGERGERQIHDIVQRGQQDPQLLAGGVGKTEAFLVQLQSGFLEVQSVVADALEVADGMEQTGDGADVAHGHAVLGDLHQIVAQTVLVDIQLVLISRDLSPPGVLIIRELLNSVQKIPVGQLAHAVGHGHTFTDGHAGGPQQQRVQEGELFGLVLALNHSPRQLFQLAGEGQEQYRGEHVEYRVAESDAHGIYGGIHKGEAEEGVAAVEQDQPHYGADDVEGDVDGGYPLGIPGNANGGDEGCDAGADVLAHDDGDGHAVGDGAGHGQRLQNAYRRGGGLDDAGKHSAHQNAQQGIVEGGEQAGEPRHIRQGTDGVLHQFHAVHQNGKAHQDAADIPPLLLFGAHDENDAHQRHHGGETFGLQEVHEHAFALDARQGQDPCRQSRADIGAHDDTDGLPQLHDAGVDQAHQHHRHGGGGLNGDGDTGAQQQTFQRIGGHALEQALQLAAGHFFETFGHGGHAVEEKGQAAAESEYGKDIHADAPLLKFPPEKRRGSTYVTHTLYM